MSYMLIMRPDKDNADRPQRYSPYYNTGINLRGSSSLRQYFKVAGADASIDNDLQITDDAGALFGKYYDFSVYIATTGATYINKCFALPGSNLGQSATWNDKFTIMAKYQLPTWPMPGTASLFNLGGYSGRAIAPQVDIAVTPAGEIILYSFNEHGSRVFNQVSSTATLSKVAGDTVTLCFLCDFKLQTQPTFTIYADGVLFDTLNGDGNDGWRMSEAARQSWEQMTIQLGGGNLYSNTVHNMEYFAMYEGLYPNPEEVKVGGTFETELAAHPANEPDTWPADSEVRSGVTYREQGTDQTGTLTLPTEAQTKSGVLYGADGTELTGALTSPTESQVLDGVQYGEDGTELTGNVLLPDAGEVQFGVTFGANGELTGTYTGTQRELQQAGFTDLPRMEGALANWMQDMVFTTITKDVVNYEVVETRVDNNFKGVIYPTSAYELQVKPEGQRDWAWYTVIAEPTIDLAVDDDVEYAGRSFRVKSKADYKDYGFIQYGLVEDWEEEE